MASVDYTVGFTLEEVQALFAVHKAELLKTMQAWNDNGNAVTKRRLDEIHVIISACQRALRVLDPDNYAPARRVGQSAMAASFVK